MSTKNLALSSRGSLPAASDMESFRMGSKASSKSSMLSSSCSIADFMPVVSIRLNEEVLVFFMGETFTGELVSRGYPELSLETTLKTVFGKYVSHTIVTWRINNNNI